MRTFAITGMVTVFMISRMILIDAMRATPPSLRMSDGTRSSAMTAQAPAFSAICACSALVTSIITPPLSISANPTLTRHSFAAFPLPLPFTFFTSILLLLSGFFPRLPGRRLNFLPWRFADNHKPSFASRQHVAGSIPDLSGVEQISALLLRLPALHNNFALHADRLQILHVELGGHRAQLAKPANLSHRLIQQRGNNSAMRHPAATLIPLPQNKPSHNAAPLIVLLKRQLHPAIIRPAAPKTLIPRIRRQFDGNAQNCFILASLPRYFVSSHQRYAATLRPPYATLPLAHLHPQQIRQRHHSARDFLFIQAGKAQPQSIGQRVLHVEITSWRKEYAALLGVNQQLASIKAQR